MTRYAPCLLALALLLPPGVSSAQSPEELDPVQEMVQAQVAINRLAEVWENEDLDLFAQLVADDPNIVVVGTDSDERFMGFDAFREARQAQFDAFENVEYHVNDQIVQISEKGNVAWFAQEIDMLVIAQGAPVRLSGVRITGVMEKRGEAWKLVQLHTSVPVSGRAATY